MTKTPMPDLEASFAQLREASITAGHAIQEFIVSVSWKSPPVPFKRNVHRYGR